MVNVMSALLSREYLMSRKRFLRLGRIWGISLFVVILGLGIGSWLGVREVRADVETPSTPAVIAKTSSSISISWSATASACYRFQVEYKLSATSMWTGAGRGHTSHFSWGVGSLRSDTTYQFRVRGQTTRADTDDEGEMFCIFSEGIGYTDWSGIKTETTNTSAPYRIGLSSTEQTPNSVTVGWSAPYNGGSAITGYEVEYRIVGGATGWTAWSETIAADATSLTVTGLLVSREYHFRGRAVNDVGKGQWSSALSQSTKSPPEQVTGLILSSADETNLSVQWQRPSSLGAIVRYEVEYRETTDDDSATWTQRTTEASVLSITIGDDTALTLDTSYEIRVRAVSSEGSGLWSVLLFAATVAGPDEAVVFDVSIDDQTYPKDAAITAWTLPTATGNDPVRYTLTPSVAGLTFDSSTQGLSGTPTEAGSFDMTYKGTDDDGDQAELSFEIYVNDTPDFGTTTIGEKNYTADASISLETLPAASGGNAPVVYTLIPSVPGVTFYPSTRQLGGIPTREGTYGMTYAATDDDGGTASLTFDIVVGAKDTAPQKFASAVPSIVLPREPGHHHAAAARGGGGQCADYLHLGADRGGHHLSRLNAADQRHADQGRHLRHDVQGGRRGQRREGADLHHPGERIAGLLRFGIRPAL